MVRINIHLYLLVPELGTDLAECLGYQLEAVLGL